MLSNLRVLSWRNNRPDFPLFELIVHLPLVISTVAIKDLNLRFNLVQEWLDLITIMGFISRKHFGDNLMRRKIHRQMELALRATLTYTMLSCLPFPFAVDLQTCAIDDDVDGAFRAMDVDSDLHLRCPFLQIRVVGDRHLGFH